MTELYSTRCESSPVFSTGATEKPMQYLQISLSRAKPMIVKIHGPVRPYHAPVRPFHGRVFFGITIAHSPPVCNYTYSASSDAILDNDYSSFLHSGAQSIQTTTYPFVVEGFGGRVYLLTLFDRRAPAVHTFKRTVSVAKWTTRALTQRVAHVKRKQHYRNGHTHAGCVRSCTKLTM
jgi:hypothetical protein